ncbi:MAG: ATP-dependent Clp protease ATP-binding subunit [Planctomycetes bacterium]|jgi:ATP-dependent Clp protease ATP-binding subunit ClpC|nr:ATP-dependent Clp protease ATP-binding subunit [Planctomycetota bacterium]
MTQEIGILYKYFDLIDGFIRVKVVPMDEPLAALANDATPPSRRDYRKLVVENCVLNLEEQVLKQVQRLYPEDLAAAEDLLYQICIDVNPALEIHSVSLPASMTAEEVTQQPEKQTEGQEQFTMAAPTLEQTVLQEVVGQDDAVRQICRSVRKAASCLNDPNRPIGTYLLVGRTGTGKTELAKSVARNLYGAKNLVRLDCSEFALPHETAKLIGAPPGYVGHNEGGTLTEALKRDPYCVVLFDEIEKGHEKLHNMLLQILDEGRLTDSKGETVSFSNAIVLMTSNVGTADYAQATNRVGFGEDVLEDADYQQLTQAALRRNFKPELLNRLDGVLTFRALQKDACAKIADMQLKQIRERVIRAGLMIRWTPSLCKAMAEKGYSEEYGAREVRRTVSQLVEEPLGDAILDGTLAQGEITIRWRAGKVVFEPSKKAAA